MITPLVLLYLAALWSIRRNDIGHALAVNWAVNQAAVMLNAGHPNFIVFIAVDLLTGVWLSLHVQTKAARQAAVFFLPMIALNAAAYVVGQPTPAWHYGVLFGLAWLQLIWVVTGIWGNGLMEIMEIMDNSGRGLRHSISGWFAFWRAK